MMLLTNYRHAEKSDSDGTDVKRGQCQVGGILASSEGLAGPVQREEGSWEGRVLGGAGKAKGRARRPPAGREEGRLRPGHTEQGPACQLEHPLLHPGNQPRGRYDQIDQFVEIWHAQCPRDLVYWYLAQF